MLREDVKELKSTVAFLNNIRVQNDCIINGLNIEPEKKPVEVVMNIAQKVGAKISECEIDDAYFIRRKNNTNSSVVVKFKNKSSKMSLLKEKKKLRECEDTKSVYVNDFLSKENIELLKHAKSLKSVGYKFIYAQGGYIYAKKEVHLRPMRIRSMDDVDSLLMNAAASGISKRRSFRDRLDLEEDDKNSDDDGTEADVISPS